MTQKHVFDIGRFEANLAGVMLPMGLRLEKVILSGGNLKVVGNPFSAELDEPGRLEVNVSEADLADFLNRMSPAGLKNVSVEAKNGLLHIRATKTVLIEVKANVTCSLRIVEGTKLFVDIQTVDVMGVGTKQLMQTQIDKINPVIDTLDFPVPSRLEEVEIVNGMIRVRGRVSPPAS
ncbi:MAG: LmeA family phospholipid-binding protein [Fimbriimonas sp.]|nr:LmeA family phospholipid-binding protein [Fimbriimonas sp.]